MIKGLTDKEVIESTSKYGNNSIKQAKKDSFIKLLIESLGDPIIKILLIALAIKVIFLFKNFDWYETIGIVIAIFLASFISSISEYGSEKAFLKLQEESSKIKVKVKRNNLVIQTSIDEIVVGDIVILETGDRIPADGKIIDGNIRVDESMINGEMKEKEKTAKLASQLYRGTVVYSGIGTMIVEKVGMNTFYGKIASEIQDKQPESPLKIRLRHLAKIISRIGYIGAFLVSFSYLFSVIIIDNNFKMNEIIVTITNHQLMLGHLLYALTLMVTVIVVAVPEG
ncbi:MAG: HAD-IC family P-type ATPase, partial [Bacilli bacterium]